MNDFFNKYADLTALSLTLVFSLVFTIFLKRRAQTKLRSIPAYFLVFGPAGILTFIFFHLFENSYRAIEATASDRFEYNFRFYSLILFGFVVAYLGGLYLKACFDKCLLGSKSNRYYFYKVSLVILVTAPLIPITPIAILPSICCFVSLMAFPFIHRSKSIYENSERDQAASVASAAS